MAKIIGLPKLSPTMEEGVLVRWVKQEGEAIAVDDLMAEVETDKATMEFRAFDAGVLLARLAPEGASLAPDAPVAIIGKAGEDIASLLADLTGKTRDPIRLDSPPSAAATAADAGALTAAKAKQNGGRVLASPVVRKRARELALDLHDVDGSGPLGRIILRDLPDHAGQASGRTGYEGDIAAASTQASFKAPASQAAVGENDQRTPLTPMRKAIATRMVAAKREAPHFYLNVDLDAGALFEARESWRTLVDKEIKLSFNDIIVYALSRALRDVPRCNASFHGDHILVHGDIHIAVAVSIEGGLVTPVLRHADRLSLSQVSAQVRELGERSRKKALKPEDMEGGTCSVSNLGMFGVDSFSAILNPPQACILSVGALRDSPVVRDGQVVAGKRMYLGLSVDHRAVDGAEGAQLLSALRQRLERPMSLLL
jgi:pyruvate dehydrogenase E2 component (dihydrolipoamide acetyltransferase)